MRDLAAKMCNGFALRERSGFTTTTHLCYRFQCGFHNYLKSSWQLRILVPYNQSAELERYCAAHSAVSRPAGMENAVHTPQTLSLVSAKSGLRPHVHKCHVCVIDTAGTHKQHNGYQETHAHCMFKAYCDLHPFALHFGKADIRNWLEHEKIDTVRVTVDERTGKEIERVDMLNSMVTRCKRYAIGKLARVDNELDINGKYAEGKLLAICEKYSLGASLSRCGQAHFDAHTAYVIPGWSASTDKTLEAGGMCVMMTSFNLILNYSRAMKWYAGKVTLALDHTYKVGSP